MAQKPENRVLKILHVISQLGQGGQETQLYYYIKGTRDACDHRVVALAQGGIFKERLSELGVVVRDLERRGRGDPHRLMRLVMEIRRYKPDIIHGHLFTGNLYSLIARRIAYPMGARPPLLSIRVTTRPQRSWMVDRMEGFTFRSSQMVIVNAHALREEICENYGVPPSRVRVLPNVLVPDRFQIQESREEIRRELGFPEEAVMAGHIASFSPEKRHDLLLNAFSQAMIRAPQIRLALIGDGPDRKKIACQAVELGIADRIHWLGWRDDVPRLLKAMDLTINASDREGSCNAILESLAMGIPVVATSVGGTPEALDQGRAGILVPPNEAAPMAEGIAKLACDALRRKSMGEAGRRIIQTRNSPSEVLPLLLSLYHEVNLGREVSTA